MSLSVSCGLCVFFFVFPSVYIYIYMDTLKFELRVNKTSYVLCRSISMASLFISCLEISSAQCSDRMNRHTSPLGPPNFKSRLKTIFKSIALGVITGLIFALLVALLFKYFVRYINKTPVPKSPIVFSPKISARTLKSALSSDPQLLGSSPCGNYFKVVLDNGLNIAVKRLEPFGVDFSMETNKKSPKKTKQELEMLAALRHRNLMSLRAYVFDSDGYYLVYDYVPTGSLDDLTKRVRANQLELKWEFRLRIAVGIVKGLHYLHFSCSPRRLHCNLKPSNVMLDSQFEPRLADCGLAALLPSSYRSSSGYNAPECFQNCRYTEKSDVFSFGVILGILLTGKDPLDPFFLGDGGYGSLGQWLRHLQQSGEARQALDESILGEEMEEHEMLMALRIAVVCLSDLPADRPSSDELASMLTQLNSF